MGEWILIVAGAVFLYFCGYGIVHMFRLRRRGTVKTRDFEDPQSGLRFRYPAEWEIRLEGERVVFITHEHDGRGTISMQPRESYDPEPSAAIGATIDEQKLELEDRDFHPFEHGAWRGGYVESRATKDMERLYLQEWVVDGPGIRVRLAYRCSVLYGQIDAFDIDQLMRTLETSPAQPE